ncbi:hypothetical protein [Cohnella sp. AR92]|uniref:hypothetical protein n=1 Tax=Cohnella sp. AR92 TaxID=648716 RepID=UPI000F8EA1F6|nr:hypothetical protein [Cohnella sp. AR92]RUS46036.1 hypothetical protein ELR57_16470 [Cohnella sp. AR92]
MAERQAAEWAEILEPPFSADGYNGLSWTARPFSYHGGSSPVLLSSPHATNHRRDGRVKYADLFTGSIGRILNLASDCPLIYANRLADEDPNHTEGGEYKSYIRSLAEEREIRCVLDLHGASLEREFDIDLGVTDGRSLKMEQVKRIQAIFRRHGIRDVRMNDTFMASGARTVTGFCHLELGLPAVQIEIHKRYREPREAPDKFGKLLHSLQEVIRFIGDEK